jgi:hypothetical protein
MRHRAGIDDENGGRISATPSGQQAKGMFTSEGVGLRRGFGHYQVPLTRHINNRNLHVMPTKLTLGLNASLIQVAKTEAG